MESRKTYKRMKRVSTWRTKLFFTGKRMIDIGISLFLLLLLAPIFVWVMCKLLKYEGRPIFTKKICLGNNNQPFVMRTFRVMSNPSQVIRELPQPLVLRKEIFEKAQHEQNTTVITTTGAWLKKYELQKLPLLIHVLMGEMSFVGTNMPMIEISHHCKMRLVKQHKIKMGMIGFGGSDAITDDYKMNVIKKDLYYIKHCSYLLDLKIMFQTMKRIIKA